MLASAAPVVVIGDAVVDILEEPDGAQARFAGGAALNTAVGLSILGCPVVLVAALGRDRNGYWVMGYLRENGVRLVPSRSCDFTGTATSSRVSGEPTYSFNPAIRRRNLTLPRAALDLLESAPAVIVNSYPFDDAVQVAALCEALRMAQGNRVVDPNPRPALMRDPTAFAKGFQDALEHADLIKLSEEDIGLIYGGSEVRALQDIREHGDASVMLTRGARGATYVRPGHRSIDVPIPGVTDPIVDTLGAGDASLATFVLELLPNGLHEKDELLVAALTRSMLVAAATTRRPGGRLRLPAERDH
jgi:fructokinase